MSEDSRIVRLGLVQTSATDIPAENFQRTVELVHEAADRGAQTVCLQELFSTRYFCQEEDAKHFALAEPVPGPTTKGLGAIAAQRKINIICSVFEKRAAGLFHNTAVLLGWEGGLAGTYRKMHIPDDPRFYEKFFFTPGDLGFRAFDTAHGRIGMLVCWDQWYPEAARLTALQGARILFYPTAIGTWQGELGEMPAQHDAWRTVQRGHAIANGVFVVAVNRVGIEDELHFWGRSFVARPDGSIAAEAGDKEEVLVVDCDLGLVEQAREGWPFFRDRRIDAYGDLTARWLDDEGS